MEIIDKLIKNIEKVIIGKRKEIINIMKGIIAGGHILIEDVPGVGKTTIVKTIAKSLNLSFKRIQFTPDLLPSDITGIAIYNQKIGKFEFKKGPIFANIILADEINRTSPKTQSALLEVMEEFQISDGNSTYFLEKPFIVLATQNPIEYEGTYLLPEAQLDRFMIKVEIGYVDKKNESNILQIYKDKTPIVNIKSIAEANDIIKIQQKIKNIKVTQHITDYISSIAEKTRNNQYIKLGISTRASLALLKIAQATALIDRRDYVIPDDIIENIIPVFSHRIILSPLAIANNLSCEETLTEILRKISIPRAE